MSKPLAVLNIEDSESDSNLIARLLKKTGYKITFERVETASQMRAALKKRAWDVIISDYSLPQFDSYSAIELLHEERLDVPFIVVSGTAGEETAVGVMKAGAQDYMMKDNLTRLIPAVERELEQAKIRRERKQLESIYRILAENSIQGVAIFQGQKMVYANPALSRINGYTNKELMAMSSEQIFSITHPDDRAFSQERINRRAAGKSVSPDFEMRVLRKDGSIRWVKAFTDQIEYEGQPAVLSTLMDITERKQADDALNASEKRFRVLIENSADAITLLDAQGFVKYDSPAAPGILGYGPDEWIGQSIFKLIHADDLREAQEMLQKLIEAAGTRMHGIFRLRHKNNSWRWMDAVVTNLLDEPGVKAIVVNYRDITERKQVEASLQESEQRFKLASWATKDVIWERNLLTNMILWNESLRKIFHFPIGEIDPAVDWWQDHIHPAERIKVINSIQTALEQGEDFWSKEYRFLLSDGSYADIFDRGYIVYNEQGEPVRMIGAMMDITERKQAEDALLASESSLQGILQSTADGILAVSLENKVLFANEHFAEMWKIPQEVISSKDDTILLQYVLDQLTNPQDFLNKVQELYKSQLGSFDVLYFKDGRIFERLSKPIMTGKNPAGRVWSFRDVTERKKIEAALLESEQAHRTLFENVPVGLYRTTVDGHILDANPALVHMFGFQDRESFLAVKVEDLYADPAVNKKFNDELVKSDISASLESEFRKRNGTTFWAEDHIQVIRDEDGNPLFYEGSLTDITERKRAEQQMRALIEAMPDGVLVANSDGNIVIANAQSEALFGYRQDELLGQPIEMLIPERIRAVHPGHRDGYLAAPKMRAMGTGLELYARRRDGSKFPVDVSLSSVETRQDRMSISVIRDITDRKRTEQAIAESEARFRQAIAAADAIPYSLNYAPDHYTFMGEGIEKLTGYSRVEMTTPALLDSLIIESNMLGRFKGISLPEAVTLVREGESGTLWQSEHRIRTRSGDERWLSDSSIQVLGENGIPTGSIGIFQDITERKLAEQVMHESEVRYRSLFEDSPVSLWEEDFSAVKLRLAALRDEGVRDFRAYFASHPQMALECISLAKIVDVNKSSLKLFGAKEKADLIHNLTWFIDNDSAELFQNELISIAQGKSHFEGEEVIQTLDGRKIIVKLNLSVMPGYEDTLSKVIISMVDITALIQAEIAIRESEKSLRESQMIAGLGSYMLDIPSEKWTSSDILNQIFGIDESYTRSVENWVEFIHPDWRQEMSDYFTNEVLGTHIRFDKEYKIVRRNDGAERWVHGLGELEFDSHNQPVKMRGTIQDITERKQAEDLLRKSEKRYHDLFEDSPIALRDEDFSAVKQWLDALRQDGITDFHAYLTLHPQAVVECMKMVKIKDVNKAALKMYRADSKDNMPKDLAEILGGKNLEHFKDQLAGIAQGQIEFGWEGIDQTIDGGQVYVEANWSVAAGYENDLSKVIVSVQDITARKQAEDNLSLHVAELELLYESGLAISQLLSPKEIGQKIIDLLEQKMNWHHTAIRLYNAKDETLELLAFHQPDLKSVEERRAVEARFKTMVSRSGQGLSGWVIQHGETVRTGDLTTDDRYVETFAGLHSGLYVPIKAGERTIGVISIESEKENAFSKSDEQLTTILAAQAASIFENARLYEDTIHRAAELEQRVTERTAQIETTKRRLELATHAGQIGVWEYNPRENKVLWDERMHMIHKIPVGGFDGTSEAWAKLIHPNDLETSLINKQLAVTKNLLLNDEHRILWPDGSVRHIMTSAVMAYSPEGAPDRIIGINMDITERKRIEQSLRESETYARLLFDAVPDPVSVTEADGVIVDINKVFEKQYGLVRDEIRGRHISELGIYSETDLDKRDKYLSEILQGQPADPVILEFNVPGEGIHTLELHSYLIRVNSRLLMLNTSHDITAYKKAEETQLLAKLEMEHALRIKNEFLANMSHELRTPLNSILGISESLEEQIVGALNEKQLKYVGVVRESGRHLLELINDILDLSKIEAGRMELDIRHISVEKFCQSSLRMIKELAQKKSLNISYKTSGDVKIILGDERRLKQSLVNLLSNAVKFSPVGSRIGLEVNNHSETNEVTFTVWDHGVGIAQEDIQHLFKPFVQLDAGLTREYQGTGLGLALVAQMVHLHGGHVKAESEVGKGSRFIITLPWSQEEQKPQAKVTAKLLFPSPRSDVKRNGRILLVEDTDVVVQLISEFLRYKGYEIILAHNGVEGMKLAAQERPDLILMDVMMPIMDGLEATQNIRKDISLQHIPIIALTALAMSGDSERCLAAGMNDYLSKPIQMQVLADMIEKYLKPGWEESNEQ